MRPSSRPDRGCLRPGWWTASAASRCPLRYPASRNPASRHRPGFQATTGVVPRPPRNARSAQETSAGMAGSSTVHSWAAPHRKMRRKCGCSGSDTRPDRVGNLRPGPRLARRACGVERSLCFRRPPARRTCPQIGWQRAALRACAAMVRRAAPPCSNSGPARRMSSSEQINRPNGLYHANRSASASMLEAGRPRRWRVRRGWLPINDIGVPEVRRRLQKKPASREAAAGIRVHVAGAGYASF